MDRLSRSLRPIRSRLATLDQLRKLEGSNHKNLDELETPAKPIVVNRKGEDDVFCYGKKRIRPQRKQQSDLLNSNVVLSLEKQANLLAESINTLLVKLSTSKSDLGPNLLSDLCAAQVGAITCHMEVNCSMSDMKIEGRFSSENEQKNRARYHSMARRIT